MEKAFWIYACQPHTLKRSIKVALVVGTILAAINYLDDILLGELSGRDLISLLATYVVPFCVATYGAAREASHHGVNPKKH